MESQLIMLSTTILALLVTCCSTLPTDDSVLQSSDLSADKRPKYMDTRDLDVFKYMLLASIRELVEDGQINPAVLTSSEEEDGELKTVTKRMHYMGICMRRRQNTFIPYPCLRSGRR